MFFLNATALFMFSICRSMCFILFLSVDHVNEMIQKTAENAAIQAENMKQLRVGIEEITHSIQDNSAASQETSTTSEELASQAEILNKMVQKFEICQSKN